MPLTNEQFNKLAKRAMSSYAKKLKLEKNLNNKIKSLFANINKDFKAHYSTFGAAQDVTKYRPALEKILNDHHIKVAQSFSNDLRNLIGTPDKNETIQRKLDANIKGYAAQRSHLMSHQILDTTRDNIDYAINSSIADKAAADEEITNESVADDASDYLQGRFLGRVTTIGTTETQSAAETGKDLEYQTMDDMDAKVDGVAVRDMVSKGVWITVLDKDTREDHVEADGQEVDSGEPFEVGGEQLMYPGDDSLGASIENLANCRCSKEFFLD